MPTRARTITMHNTMDNRTIREERVTVHPIVEISRGMGNKDIFQHNDTKIQVCLSFDGS